MYDTQQYALTQEWVTLQNNHAQYERNALIVKLVSIILFTVSAFLAHGMAPSGAAFFGFGCFVLCLLWVQEAMVRTSQARLGKRLLRIETLHRTAGNEMGQGAVALQLHSEWQADRAGSLGLLGEYACEALRPTVAFPHAPLAALLLFMALCH